MGRRCIWSDIYAGVRQQLHGLRPFQLMKFTDAVPDIFEITALGFTWAADSDDREATLREVCRDRAPSVRCPSLIGEHRRGVDDGVFAVECNGRALRCRG